MQFIEMSGSVLLRVIGNLHDGTDGALTPDELRDLGVTEQSLVRVNRQGDIEIRRPDRWDCIGGLLGEFDKRVRKESGRDWA